ncbi:MAG: tetrahydromethanopterin S-methyltransferase subunit A [Methanohalophilus sp. T328-1]|jgi:tetrahydromethanopterin S-methyltransferase subunit A|uniref:tetrahydromethanopterin S-methyltransferase subunit A n=1 Tax=Methanohalophilus sp. DAL1 TaxID=1864608 RepID=UPI000793624D|nr:tetrahydromethanopterin S-methyltransferase subunit A [Methanohalophilus sp. DAL1]KXS44015.1 MAG: tetrahydromethanopterin S-methyltransferase subunit A [Methanohalophilus sp. T328-1]OBZ34677.1 MAG: tetrahydromethanopterin S-methyltransferase subunit A [Methanohalophilus sp. DAL1]OBZ34975.1 MAG: tetrahydromethanopterin S-methyltransferase subunit A [Methanohalophilus sp. DAL1]
MAEKREPAPGWPILKGEYEVGDPENCVAVITLGSHLEGGPLLDAGASIAGPCKTENLGLEKVISHIIANPNIRYLVVTGSEVKGHITGEAFVMLHKNGVSDNRIVNASGAIPYVENLTEEAVQRYQEQVECIDLIGTEDMGTITGKIKELAAKDPGAFDADPLVVEVGGEEEEEEEVGGLKPMASEFSVIRGRILDIEREMARIGEFNKFHAGVHAGKIEGIMIGLTITLSLLGLILFGR